MDREGDSYRNICQMQYEGYHFIIRGLHDRRLLPKSHLMEFMADVPVMSVKTVKLNQRKESRFAKRMLVHPPRVARTAQLSITASTLTIGKTHFCRSREFPSSLTLNVVQALERNPPKGEKPVEWTLLTSEPITNTKAVLSVIEYYRRRWFIEEFFKGLKTGCKIEQRQLITPRAWYNTLLLFLDVVTEILNLRVSSSQIINAKKPNPFSKVQYQVLKKMAATHNLPCKTTTDAMLIIAKMGGFIINNKNGPGWITLSRGYKLLITLSKGYVLAKC